MQIERAVVRQRKGRRASVALFGVVLGLYTSPALAAEPTGPPAAPAATVAQSVGPAPVAPSSNSAPSGLAVVALAGATDVAWPLAQGVYGEAALRPVSVDDAHARVLCGEPAPPGSDQELVDLAETVAAIRGDDAPSRALLAQVARRLSVRGIVVVAAAGARPSAGVFLADSGAFDAARYESDAGPTLSWSGAVTSMRRAFGRAPPEEAKTVTRSSAPQAPALATHEAPKEGARAPGRAFYESGWFWTAVGAAAAGALAVVLATRDSGASTIHVQVQVPR